jgi:hypothetical protein
VQVRVQVQVQVQGEEGGGGVEDKHQSKWAKIIYFLYFRVTYRIFVN